MVGGSGSRDHNCPVYCPSCGTAVDALPCPVCGAAAPDHPAASTPPYAGWWQRAGATVVDNLVLLIPTYIVFLLGDAVGGWLLGAAAGLAVQGLYLVAMLSRPDGQTIGNRMVGTRVRDATTGLSITRQQAMRRWVVIGVYSALELAGTTNYAILLTIPALVDCLYPLFNERKQTWHDRIAGTLVLRG